MQRTRGPRPCSRRPRSTWRLRSKIREHNRSKHRPSARSYDGAGAWKERERTVLLSVVLGEARVGLLRRGRHGRHRQDRDDDRDGRRRDNDRERDRDRERDDRRGGSKFS